MKIEKECIAMLLAGGQGSRLGALTKNIAKPAVSFGGKYKIIDFTLSNCANSHIDTVGVLTQYRPFQLNSYVGNGSAWDFTDTDGGLYVLPPYVTETEEKWYRGTADAIFQNIDFINMFKASHVLILSGDHIYRMDYRRMLKMHTDVGADVTISVMPVPIEEASRFGILTTDNTGRITKFSEKPKKPDSNLASMGIYIFNTDILKRILIEDSVDDASEHDFGKNIIPKLLAEGKHLHCYEFNGFWKDVGTIPSYYETSMDLLENEPQFSFYDENYPMMSNSNIYPVQYIGDDADIDNCLVNNGCRVFGKATHSILGIESLIEAGAEVVDSILLPGAQVRKGAKVYRAIVGENAVVDSGITFGKPDGDIAVLGNNLTFSKEGILA